jgi:hypothetical protein
MGRRSDFWFHVHELSLCLETEGTASRDRRRSILESLESLPRMARERAAGELRHLLAELCALHDAMEDRQELALSR